MKPTGCLLYQSTSDSANIADLEDHLSLYTVHNERADVTIFISEDFDTAEAACISEVCFSKRRARLQTDLVHCIIGFNQLQSGNLVVSSEELNALEARALDGLTRCLRLIH
jgi:hypothetical protein